MRKNIGLLCIVFFSLFASLHAHEFYGRHFTASYKRCNEKALCDINKLMDTFENAVQATGATVLQCDYKIFPGGGVTIFIIVSESHASIHTYPEHSACFVDLFTCGSHCTHEPFDKMLTEYLQPIEVSKQLHIRE